VVAAPKFSRVRAAGRAASLAGSAAALLQSRGWRFFQSGDLKTAERDFGAALHATPDFYPAELSLGYLELARKDAKAALPHFDRRAAADRSPGRAGARGPRAVGCSP